MYVARDNNGDLTLFLYRPKRSKDYGGSWEAVEYEDVDSDYCTLNKKLFPKLTWEDDPIEVSLVSSDYSKLVESKRDIDYNSAWNYCKNNCNDFAECIRESEGFCDTVKRMFEKR